MSTTYMALSLPNVGENQWGTKLNTALTTIDLHDHASGRGAQVPASGLNINADLSFGSNYLKDAKALRFTNQSSPLAAGSDVKQLYVYANNLYYINDAGVAVQLTNGNAIAGGTPIATAFTRLAVAGNITILSTDTYTYYEVSTAGARSITLPAANAVSAGRFYWFKDSTGQAATNNITINRAGADTIEGATSKVINDNYQAIMLISDGTSKWYVVNDELDQARTITQSWTFNTGTLTLSGTNAINGTTTFSTTGSGTITVPNAGTLTVAATGTGAMSITAPLTTNALTTNGAAGFNSSLTQNAAGSAVSFTCNNFTVNPSGGTVTMYGNNTLSFSVGATLNLATGGGASTITIGGGTSGTTVNGSTFTLSTTTANLNSSTTINLGTSGTPAITVGNSNTTTTVNGKMAPSKGIVYAPKVFDAGFPQAETYNDSTFCGVVVMTDNCTSLRLVDGQNHQIILVYNEASTNRVVYDASFNTLATLGSGVCKHFYRTSTGLWKLVTA